MWFFPLLLACSSPPAEPTTEPTAELVAGRDAPQAPGLPPSFLLIDIDSLRADRILATREGQPVAPTLAALARRGVRFDQAYSQSGWTLPAVYSLVTGHHPLLVEVREDTLPRRDPAVRHLPEILGLYGYRSMVFWGRTIIGGNGQLSTGFDDTLGVAAEGGYRVPLQDWIEQAQGQPFFALVHNLDLHMPSPAIPIDALHRFVEPVEGCPGGVPMPVLDQLTPTIGVDAAREHVIGHYDGQLRYYDDAVADMLEQLERAAVADRTVVILTSDHGEELFERGELRHGVHYDPVLRIPLVIASPGAAAGQVDRGAQAVVQAVVQTVDIVPTVLELAGAELPAGLAGQSLVPLLGGGGTHTPRAVLSISNRYNASLRTATHKALVRSSYRQPGQSGRLVDGGLVREVFDLVADPGERRPLIDTPGGAELFRQLDAWRAERLVASEELPRARMDPEQERKLKEHGYWGLTNPDGEGREGPPPGTRGKPRLDGDPPVPE